MFTAKELTEIEDRVYAQVNVKLTYAGHASFVQASKRLNTAGIFPGASYNDYQTMVRTSK